VIEQACLVTLKAAYVMETVRNKAAKKGNRDDEGEYFFHGTLGH